VFTQARIAPQTTLRVNGPLGVYKCNFGVRSEADRQSVSKSIPRLVKNGSIKQRVRTTKAAGREGGSVGWNTRIPMYYIAYRAP